MGFALLFSGRSLRLTDIYTAYIVGVLHAQDAVDIAISRAYSIATGNALRYLYVWSVGHSPLVYMLCEHEYVHMKLRFG